MQYTHNYNAALYFLNACMKGMWYPYPPSRVLKAMRALSLCRASTRLGPEVRVGTRSNTYPPSRVLKAMRALSLCRASTRLGPEVRVGTR